MAILVALRVGPATATQIAADLGVHPANLTRHLRILVKAGLIAQTRTRDTGRNLEKYYEAQAQSFEVAPDADKLAAPHKVALSFARSELSRAIAQLPDECPGLVEVYVAACALTPAAQAEFAAALSDLVERFQKQQSPEGQPFTLVLSLHPTAAHSEIEGRVQLSKPKREKRK
ncbi:MAG: winged helix-turn-helix domain-containing protein [Hyphomonadaceae bacterium]|nr:winged helix-turn-helix domain-containing protein [Hyphomonadaceae bacterium]